MFFLEESGSKITLCNKLRVKVCDLQRINTDILKLNPNEKMHWQQYTSIYVTVMMFKKDASMLVWSLFGFSVVMPCLVCLSMSAGLCHSLVDIG